MKKTLLLFAAILLAIFIAPFAGAQTNIEEKGEQMMDQMMGTKHESMDSFMDSMMGGSGKNSMHEMMGKLTDKGITADDLKPMAQFMSACQNQSSGNYFSGMMGNFGNMMGIGFGLGGALLLFGWIIMIIFWIAVILGALALIKWFINQLRGGESGSGKALEIVKEKYAKGEISKEEYEAKKKDLT